MEHCVPFPLSFQAWFKRTGHDYCVFVKETRQTAYEEPQSLLHTVLKSTGKYHAAWKKRWENFPTIFFPRALCMRRPHCVPCVHVQPRLIKSLNEFSPRVLAAWMNTIRLRSAYAEWTLNVRRERSPFLDLLSFCSCFSRRLSLPITFFCLIYSLLSIWQPKQIFPNHLSGMNDAPINLVNMLAGLW